MTQILVADVSMSLDNVPAVAGAAHGHLWVPAVGPVFSVVLMALAAAMIARPLGRHAAATVREEREVADRTTVRAAGTLGRRRPSSPETWPAH